MKLRILSLALLLALAMPGLVAFASPLRQATRIELAVSAGYNGYAHQGQWIPVRVSLSNPGDSLSGEIRVRTDGTSGLAATSYSTPVDLPQGSRKQIFLYVSLGSSFTPRLQVELLDLDNHVVQRESVDIHTVGTVDVLYAVLTSSPYGAVDLTAGSPGSGDSFQANWLVDNIPPQADALAGLDVMLFHDIDTGVLQAEQRDAILRWVLTGGHLIIAGGDEWQRTTAAFQDLLPVDLQGTTTIPSLAALGEYLRAGTDGLEGETTVTESTPRAGGRALVSAGDIPLIVRGTYGQGTVDFLAVDPNTEPLRSWDRQELLWYLMVASTGQQPSWGRGFTNWSTGREATLTTSSTVLPTFLQLCGFLILYILLVGPVNYLVLKRANQRELAWFTIPIFIVIFSLLAYSVGFNLRGNTATVNRLTVVRAWPEAEQAQVMSLIGIQSPRRTAYDVAVERDYLLRTLPDVGTGLSVPVAINEETRYVARQVPIDAGTIASFTASGFSGRPTLDAQATWHLSEQQVPRIEGSVTNTSDTTLEDAVLLIKGESRELGTIKPGETQHFNITLGPQDPGPVTLGNPLGQYNLYYASPWRSATHSPGWCFNAPGMPLTVPDVMRDAEFSCSLTNVSSHEQEIRRRYRLISTLVSDTELSGGRGMGAYLFAWSHDSVVEVELIRKPQNEEDTTLYIFALPITVTAETSHVAVPPSLTTWTVTEKDDPRTVQDIAPSQFSVDNGAQAAFEFMPLPQARLASVDALEVNFLGVGPLTVDLWNWAEQKWETPLLSTDTTMTTLPDPGDYLGPENAVRVRVEAQDSTAYNQVDYIKIGYRGRLAG